MKPASILYELRELRDSWRKQSFSYTNEQQKRYNELLELRRARVKEFFDTDGNLFPTKLTKSEQTTGQTVVALDNVEKQVEKTDQIN